MDISFLVFDIFEICVTQRTLENVSVLMKIVVLIENGDKTLILLTHYNDCAMNIQEIEKERI